MEQQKEATASGSNLPLSYKNIAMVGDFIRGRTVEKAKWLLQRVMEKKVAVPYTKFNMDRGHKKGEIAAGRYPIKTAAEVLNLLKSAESNAINMGMNASNLVVSRFIGNKGSTSWRSGRKRRIQAKTAHIELFLAEKKAENKKKGEAKK